MLRRDAGSDLSEVKGQGEGRVSGWEVLDGMSQGVSGEGL